MKQLKLIILITFLSTSVFANGPSLLRASKPTGKFQYNYSIIKNQNDYLNSFKSSASSIKKVQQDPAARPNVPGNLMFDFGIPLLQNHPGEMTQDHLRSRAINIYYLYEMRLGESNFTFNPGIGLGFERFTFVRNQTLSSDIDGDGNQVSFIPAQDLYENTVNIRRSRLINSYVDVPVEFRWHSGSDFNRSFKIAIGGVFGLLIDAKTKVQYEVDGTNKTTKQKDPFNLNPIRYGAIARVGIAGFNLWGYYNLSPLFRSGQGPQGTENTNYFNVGLSLTLF